MSVSAPPRPRLTTSVRYTEPQPRPVIRRASPDGLPVIGWCIGDGLRHSRITVTPLGNPIDPHERFAVTLKFFAGQEEPFHTFLSEPFAGDDMFRYESADLLAALR